MRSLTIVLIAATLGATALAVACHSAKPTGDAGVGAADAGPDALPPLESADPAIVPPDARRDDTSSPLVFDTTRGGVWTANGDVGSISYVDIDAAKVVQEVPVGKDIRSVALSPDARWIAAVDRDGAAVVLVDAETRAVRRSIALGTHPRAAVWDSANPRWLYVAVEDDNTVVIVDRVAGAIEATIPVGRLPSGLAVSRKRRELYVSYRVDAKVSVVDLASWAVKTDVPLADQAADPDPTVPQGKPFAFESIAWAADGNVAWVPHELLAPFHPFQFQRVLFPAVSVVDLSADAEVVTDPTTGIIAGRKVLFDAIDILDPTGNTSIVSQPCAAAMHPNGFVAYVVACASEDLLVFDTTQGIAVDLLRNLPGDHPVGITLDDTGQRAWILSDQSHTLQMLDLGGGSLVEHVRIVGAPIPLVATDPVDPEMRQGLELWFSANAQKGDLATTGNDWMSCGGCHLDGLVSTNAFLFEALHPADSTQDAQIGHVGLHDLFSTAPTPTDPSFAPNDILIALLDQGGLAPDRTGANRAGQIDPTQPTPAATLMAQRLARVIARDLPVGPSWLLSPGDKPNTDYDGAWCGTCHQAEYAAWSKSVHAHAAEDPMVLFGMGIEQAARGPQYSRQCAGCHDPVSVRVGDTSFGAKRSITCLGCHDTQRLIRAGGNSDVEFASHAWDKDHKAWGLASLETLRDPQFCGGCHQQFVPGTGILAITTLNEYTSSDFSASGGSRCVDCHMPVTSGVADHSAPGGNVFMGTMFGDANLVAAETQNLKNALTLTVTSTLGGFDVTVKNRGAGHSFPTGVSDIREAWVEVQAVDAQSNVLATYGGPDATGLIPSTAARLGMDIATADGTVLLLHQLTQATRIPFDFRVPAESTLPLFVPASPTRPAGTDHLDAVLLYRNVRTTYYRAATGDASGSAPTIEVARVTVQ